MHLLLGDTSRMFRSVSTVFGLPGSRVWWGMIRCHLFFLICRTSDAILGDIPFRRIFMDLRRGHMLEDRWFHAIWSPTYHTFRCHIGAYFRSDEIYISWGNCVLILICEMYAEMMIYSLSSWWFLSRAYREPSSQVRTFRCLDVVMLPSEDASLISGFASVAGIDDLSSSNFSTCYIFDATLGHIPHLDRDL